MSKTIYRKDYTPYPFEINHVHLTFDLDPAQTTVHNHMKITSKSDASSDLVLTGEDIHLINIKKDGVLLTKDQDYHLHHEDETIYLTILNCVGSFDLEVTNQCVPQDNTQLMGLYISGGAFFTQCEAEGFRRITFYADRPDVMSIFDVTLRADKKYTYLLSNGNLIETTELEDGRHQAHWNDPFRKPCYLFALVAGDFDMIEKYVTTKSGKDVLLQVYSDRGSMDQTQWALTSLENSLYWDEKRFGLELDLDRFMIVAAQDFNMGAMENKGLNIFNAACALANKETATDANFERIESIIGHEYFHNWTGNRVTCQDWFQLSLKEGLTVFRDQEFSMDMLAKQSKTAKGAASARAVKRIEDVNSVRSRQFPEDASPMAHPIRPDSFQDISNFYTMTVYEKGAEIIRMQHTLLGEEGFRRGMDEYFRRHDGQAVTCDDFVNAMEWSYQQDHPDSDWRIFRRWYQQAGTPTVEVTTKYDDTMNTYEITLSQSCPKVGVEKTQEHFTKLPFHIPIQIGLLDTFGHAIKIDGKDSILLELKEETQTFTLKNIPTQPVVSLLRNFSAPIKINYERSLEELALLAEFDTDPVARWDAMQTLSTRIIFDLVSDIQKGQKNLTLNPILINISKNIIHDHELDNAYRALLLTLPDYSVLSTQCQPIDPIALNQAIDFVEKSLAIACQGRYESLLPKLVTTGPYSPDPMSAGVRRLRNLALKNGILAGSQTLIKAAHQQYENAENMTDRMGALVALLPMIKDKTVKAHFDHFYQMFKNNNMVIDKWFALQCSAPSTTLDDMKALMKHPAFTLKNPNRARASVFAFCNNMHQFHQTDGRCYQFWADQVIALNGINPDIASRLARAMDSWTHYRPDLKQQMKSALERVEKHPDLAKNVAEIINKSLHIA